MSIVTFETGTAAVSSLFLRKERCRFHSPRRGDIKGGMTTCHLAQEQKSNICSDIYDGQLQSVIAVQENSSENYSIQTSCPVMSYF
ncbi:hypothetical protein CEXT_806311 [Caerostris extrusa]|uniref:Uncharacterized protein n=1 Tax=Caerostris extrusa TaxID=172846 RepID=A0AAV4R0W4_CAEEX|nr:hypothetical protein CEXT_806311 [Caerostris extrusa]